VTGDVDSAVSQVLPPNITPSVRNLVQHELTVDETIVEDLAAGRKDQLNGTPAFVVVSKGKREVLPGSPSLSLLQAYIEQTLRP
jgi:hypothetical protein